MSGVDWSKTYGSMGEALAYFAPAIIDIFPETEELLGDIVEVLSGVADNRLREQVERSRGCKYCNREDVSEAVCYIPLDNWEAVDVPYNVCSNCGKRLEVERDE